MPPGNVRQFTPDALARILLNVERAVLIEALEDPRLVEFAVLVKKDEVLEAIENLKRDIFPEDLLKKNLREFVRGEYQRALEDALEGKEQYCDKTGILNRAACLFYGAAATYWEWMLESGPPTVRPEPPQIEEFDGGGTGGFADAALDELLKVLGVGPDSLGDQIDTAQNVLQNILTRLQIGDPPLEADLNTLLLLIIQAQGTRAFALTLVNNLSREV